MRFRNRYSRTDLYIVYTLLPSLKSTRFKMLSQPLWAVFLAQWNRFVEYYRNFTFFCVMISRKSDILALLHHCCRSLLMFVTSYIIFGYLHMNDPTKYLSGLIDKILLKQASCVLFAHTAVLWDNDPKMSRRAAQYAVWLIYAIVFDMLSWIQHAHSMRILYSWSFAACPARQ